MSWVFGSAAVRRAVCVYWTATTMQTLIFMFCSLLALVTTEVELDKYLTKE